MSFLALIPIELGLMVLGRLLRPKSPQRPGDKFNVPDIVEGTCVPYVFGTAKVERPFLAWWGKVDSVLGQDFGGVKPTEYYAAMVFDICQGPVDELVDVAIGGKSLSIWPKTAASLGQPQRQVIVPGTPDPVTPSLPHGFGVDNMVEFNVDAQDLLGGLGKDGGVVGQIRFYPGISTGIIYEPLLLGAGATVPAIGGNPNPVDGSTASGQPFICYAAFDGYPSASWPGGVTPPRFASWWWGNNDPTPRTVSFVVGRWPGQLQDAFRVIGSDANAVNVIWELLTDPIAGAGLDEALFDKTAFQAAAEQVYRDGLGVSGTIDTPTKLYDLLVDLLRHIDGTIFPDPITGLYTIALARPDYDPTTLDVLDETRVDELTVSRFDWSETINQLIVTYRRLASGPIGGTAVTGEILTLHFHATFLGSVGYYNTAGQNPTSITVHNLTQGTSAVPAPGTSVTLVNAPNGTIRITNDFADEGDELTVDYTSGSTEVGFVEASNPIQNLANRQATGEVRSETVDFRFFTNDVSAFSRGRILLGALSSPLDKVTWIEDRRGNVRRPGGLVVFNEPEKGLNNTVIRIVGIDYGLLQQGKIKCEGVEDPYGKLLEADLGAPGGTSAPPTNPVVRQAPAMAISCVSPGAIRIGLFGQVGFSIELHRATDGSGTGDTLVSDTIAGTDTFYDDAQSIGVTKYYRARLIAPGFDPGPWTAWLGCTASAGTPGTPVCTIPTVAEAKTETATVGTLTLTITDPQARLIMVEAKSQQGTAPETAYATLAGPTYAPTVNFTGALRSTITYRVSYLDCSGGISQIVKTVNFDAPNPPNLTPKFLSGGVLVSDWSIDATGLSVKIAGSLTASPDQATVDATTALNGASGTAPGLTSPDTASPGDTGYVSGVAFSGTGGTGRESSLVQANVVDPVGATDPGTVIGQLTYRELLLSGGQRRVAIPSFPSSATDLATFTGVTALDHWHKDLSAAAKAAVRFQARVVAALSGAKLALQYYNGSTWRYLDGVSGPLISLAATGLIVGDYVPVESAALADLEHRIVAAGGDDASLAAIGGLLLEWAVGAPSVTIPGGSGGTGGGGTNDCADVADDAFEYATTADAVTGGWTLVADPSGIGTYSIGVGIVGGSTYALQFNFPYSYFANGTLIARRTFGVADGLVANQHYTVKIKCRQLYRPWYDVNTTLKVIGGDTAGLTGTSDTVQTLVAHGLSDSSGNLTIELRRDGALETLGASEKCRWDNLQFLRGNAC